MGECLQSLRLQTFTNWEAIVVDDGSTDESVKSVLAYSLEDSRIRLVQRGRNPKGAPTCRNIGIQHSRGAFIIFNDSDDELGPNCLENRLDNIRNSSLDFIVTKGVFFENSYSDAKAYWNIFTEEDDLKRFLRGDVVWPTPGPTWRKSFLQSNSLYWNEEALSSQDLDYHIRALLTTPNYKKLDIGPDYFVRRSVANKASSISTNHFLSKKIHNRVKVLNRLKNRLVAQNCSAEYLNLFAGLYFQDALTGVLKDQQFTTTKSRTAIASLPVSFTLKLQANLYLRLAEFFVRKFYFGYRVLYKLAKIAGSDYLFNRRSNYRTPINKNTSN